MELEDYFKKAEKEFRNLFHEENEHRFISYGRLELCGNHTDHNHGLCLVGTCSLSIKGAVSKDDKKVTIKSDNYRPFSFDIDDLEVNEKEYSTSIALTKGVLYKMRELGYKIGGFKATLNSNIFSGAGVSSSAAFELFVGEVINALYNEDKISRLELAQIGQFSENVYFGKRSGLLDQCGSSFGGVCFLDFKDPANAVVEPIPFPNWPMKIFLVNPGMSHAHMDNLYSSIPDDMKCIARAFNKSVLRELDYDEFKKGIDSKENLKQNQIDRATHFFKENKRVLEIVEAVKTENMDSFLSIVRRCEKSQENYLRNVVIEGRYEKSPLQAVNRAMEVLKRGAARVMGGGFAGSIICLVPNEEEKDFIAHMSAFYDMIIEVSIPSIGAHEVK
ncbi:MAG: galactokinase [Bacilli bacterium]|nr:galactokinase [Bacilli bacterium]